MRTPAQLGLQPIGNHIPDPGVLADVVFVHGLTGDAKGTWGTEPYWPEVLANQHPNARVWSYGHKAPMFNLSDANGVKKELQDTSTQLLSALTRHDVGKKPLVFITHSLGGLIVKAAIRQDQNSPVGRPTYRQGTRAVVFIATPHSGSSLANFAKFFPETVSVAADVLTTLFGWVPGVGYAAKEVVRESKLVDQLVKNTALLRELAQWYRDWAQHYDVMTKAYFETSRYKKVALVVDPSSADPGVPLCTLEAVDDADHSTIAKPKVGDPVYTGVDRIVSDVEAMAKAGKANPIFQEHTTIQEALSATLSCQPKFKRIPVPLPKSFDDIPAEGDVRIDFLKQFTHRLESKCKKGMINLSVIEEQEAEESNFEIDRLVLRVWLEYKAKQYFSEMRDRIHYKISDYNPTSKENQSLNPLYHSVRILDKAVLEALPDLLDELYDAKAKIIKRRESQKGKMEKNLMADGDGKTRRLLSKIISELDAMKSAKVEFNARSGTEPEYDGGKIVADSNGKD
ncbi:MAG: esterase/lipase family protein [Nitrospiraceae bacterium]